MSLVQSGGRELDSELKEDEMDKVYEEPTITDHGSLSDLTLQSKDFTGSDGLDLLGIPLGNAS